MTTGQMRVMGNMGDLKVVWDKSRPEEVEAAKKQFEEMTKKKKYAAYKVDKKDGTKGAKITEFDADAEMIILAPAMAGG